MLLSLAWKPCPKVDILNSESHYGTLLFSSVMSHGRSGSQELGHLKLVAFAGAWLSKEFSRAHWIFPVCAPQKAIYHRYSGFLLCVLLKKPFTPFTLDFSSVCSSKCHLPPLHGILRSTHWKNPVCSRKLL